MMDASTLHKSPKELSSILSKHLAGFTNEIEIKELLEKMKNTSYKFYWINSEMQFLESPNSPLLSTLKGHQEWVNAFCITSDGKKIISGSGNPSFKNSDNMIKIWKY
jgi:WD40 repeat protein